MHKNNTAKTDRLHELVDRSVESAKKTWNRTDTPQIVVSPYRFNPLGAHVDHQGGHVLARTIDQYTLLPFWPNSKSAEVTLSTDHPEWKIQHAAFKPGDTISETNWIRYAQATVNTVAAVHPVRRGFTGHVEGTRIGAGLSSSASVILAYLSALATINDLQLTPVEMVELARQVENIHMGLNNGIQDQMSIVYGQPNALSLLNMQTAMASTVPDAPSANDVCWVVCYSGFSRELINSGFNTRVQECQKAAFALDSSAKILGNIDPHKVTDAQLTALPPYLAGRARHFFTETQRVSDGVIAWQLGMWERFGQLMNDSCHSSITQYESGSQPLIDLHEIASATSGVLGSRFSGGGYGGCLLMLTERHQTNAVKERVLEKYVAQYPEKAAVAQCFVAMPEGSVRVECITQ